MSIWRIRRVAGDLAEPSTEPAGCFRHLVHVLACSLDQDTRDEAEQRFEVGETVVLAGLTKRGIGATDRTEYCAEIR